MCSVGNLADVFPQIASSCNTPFCDGEVILFGDNYGGYSAGAITTACKVYGVQGTKITIDRDNVLTTTRPLSLYNITITGKPATAPSASLISTADDGTLHLFGVSIVDFEMNNGVLRSVGDVSLSHCTFANIRAAATGYGIVLTTYSHTDITDSVFINNTDTSTGKSYGAVLLATSTVSKQLHITRSHFSGTNHTSPLSPIASTLTSLAADVANVVTITDSYFSHDRANEQMITIDESSLVAVSSKFFGRVSVNCAAIGMLNATNSAFYGLGNSDGAVVLDTCYNARVSYSTLVGGGAYALSLLSNSVVTLNHTYVVEASTAAVQCAGISPKVITDRSHFCNADSPGGCTFENVSPEPPTTPWASTCAFLCGNNNVPCVQPAIPKYTSMAFCLPCGDGDQSVTGTTTTTTTTTTTPTTPTTTSESTSALTSTSAVSGSSSTSDTSAAASSSPTTTTATTTLIPTNTVQTTDTTTTTSEQDNNDGITGKSDEDESGSGKAAFPLPAVVGGVVGVCLFGGLCVFGVVYMRGRDGSESDVHESEMQSVATANTSLVGGACEPDTSPNPTFVSMPGDVYGKSSDPEATVVDPDATELGGGSVSPTKTGNSNNRQSNAERSGMLPIQQPVSAEATLAPHAEGATIYPGQRTMMRAVRIASGEGDVDDVTQAPVTAATAKESAPMLIAVDEAITEMKMDDPLVKRVAYLGSGTFGDVFRYKWNYINVAVKVVKNVTADSVQDFIEEAQTLAQLRCPYCVSYAGICLEPLAIVTEYMAGGDLYKFLREDPSVCTIERKCAISVDIAAGLAFLHSNGIAHRDLKPANILLTKHYDAKLADFGLSGDKEASLDGAGTPMYCAPEVLRGQTAGLESDIYSFGVILIEMLGGVRPFGDESAKRKADPAMPPADLSTLTLPHGERMLPLVSAMVAVDVEERADIAGVLEVFDDVFEE